jgi:hypothetical protein
MSSLSGISHLPESKADIVLHDLNQAILIGHSWQGATAADLAYNECLSTRHIATTVPNSASSINSYRMRHSEHHTSPSDGLFCSSRRHLVLLALGHFASHGW